MRKNKEGMVDLKVPGLGLEYGEESKEVSMALSVDLFFLLELTLKGSEISLKHLLRGNSR